MHQNFTWEFILSYNNAENFNLKPEDKILVYEDINYRNNFTYRVEGEVNKPGTYPLTKGITLQEAISKAGGLTELSSMNNILVKQEFTGVDESDEIITFTKNVANIDLDFELFKFYNKCSTIWECSALRVMLQPCLVAYERGLTMSQAIIQAGVISHTVLETCIC